LDSKQLSKREARLAAEEHRQEREYWLKALAGEWTPARFPEDLSGAAEPSFELIEDVHLADDLSVRLLDFCGGSDITVHVFLTAAAHALLGLLQPGHRVDHVILTPIPRQETNAPLINTLLPIRASFSRDTTFKQLLLAAREAVAEGDRHLNFPLLETFPSLRGIDVAVLSEAIHDPRDLEPLQPAMIWRLKRRFKTLSIGITYDCKVYKPRTVELLAKRLETLIRRLLFDVGVDIPLRELDVWLPGEKERLLETFDNCCKDYPLDNTLDRLFTRQTERTSDVVAIRGPQDNLQLSYACAGNCAAGLADHLRKRGIGAGKLVGIVGDPSLDVVLAVWGTLFAGAAYVPIDPSWPRLRRDYVANDCCLSLILHEGDDCLRQTEPASALKPEHGPLDPVYVIYTSGSTGAPKGVVVEHKGLVNYVSWACEVYLDGERCGFPLFSSPAFDLTVTSLFVPLVSGNSLIVFPKGDMLATLQSIFHHPLIHTVKLTPSHLRMALELPPAPSAVRRLIVGGEELPPDLALSALERFGKDIAIFNEYGPTETVVGCMIHRFDPANDKASVPIGYPAGNARVYILDEKNGLLPPGALGELCIGGEGVTSGYLNHPEKTADSFVIDPLRPGERIYKSGDLVRYTSDGPMQFSGRLDGQVKIRGFRVEPGEVEAVLRTHPSVAAAVVTIHNKKGQANRLIYAYVVLTEPHDWGEEVEEELLEFLHRRLPEHMIPARFVALDAIPLTVNGKVDIEALPDAPSQKMEAAPPRHEVDRRLRAIWAGVLELPEESIGIDANYFRLGGHSLSAVRLLSRIHQQFQVKIPLAEFFRIPHIRGLSDYMANTAGHGFTPVEPVEKMDYYPLSSAQSRIFILQTMDPKGTGYNTPMVVELTGPLESGKLERVLKMLIARHQSFRTSFHMLEDRPIQLVHEDVEFAIQYRDAGQWDDHGPEAVTAEIKRFVAPFDLAAAPLLRALLVKLSAERHVLALDMHHIVADGVSLGILVRDFMDFYAGKSLAPLAVQYRDYALWQLERSGSGEWAAQKQYWLERFSDSVPLLDLPADFPRPDIMSDGGRLEEFVLDSHLTGQLKTLAQTQDATLFMTLLAVLHILLSRLSGQDDIVVGTPVAGRPHVDLEGIIGMFVNTLALRTISTPEILFPDFLNLVKADTAVAFSHQDFPFEDLVDNLSLRRDTGRNPLFDVMLVLQNMDIPEVSIPGLTLAPYGYEHRRAKFDLIFNGEEVGEEIHFVAEYSTDLYTRDTILRFIDYFKRLAVEISQHPDRPIGAYTLISQEEKEEILRGFNRNRSEIFGADPRELNVTIQEMFLNRVDQQPDSVAVAFEDRYLSYGHLQERSNCLARRLEAEGAGPESIVAIRCHRSDNMIAGLLGILCAGAAYLPIDPNQPDQRQEFMLRDSGVAVLLSEGQAGVAADTVVDLDGALTAGPGEWEPSLPFEAGNPAFVLYTSGTTGRPKGVMVEHRQALNVLWWFGRTYDIGPGFPVALLTDFTFDPSVNQIFGTLLWGGCLDVISSQRMIYKEKLREFIACRQIRLVYQVPSFLKELLDRQPRLTSLLTVISGGDRLADDLKDRLLAVGYNLYNHYGPTETGVDACALRCASAKVTIGTPIPNARVVVLGPCGTLQPVGVAGELCISGQGVARGYLNRPELTAERFAAHPFFDGETMYRSGDCARFLADGSVEFLGRLDQQVKVRGFRVETGEIRALLMHHPLVADAAVVDVPLGAGEVHLAAFVVTEGDDHDWNDYLAERLPYYMVPSRYITIASIPVTANGKVDRNRLRRMAQSCSVAADFTPPRDDMERRVADIWKEVLGREEIGVMDNFFDSGGNSLSILRVNARLKELMDRDIPVVAMFKYPTIRSLARYLHGETGDIEVENNVQAVSTTQRRESCDVAVIGMAGRFPGAPDVETFWRNLERGKESVSFFSKQELADEGIDARSLEHPDYVPAAAILENKQYFDAAFFDYSPNEALIMDPQIRIFHQCAWGALEDAGYCPDVYDGKIGIYAGAANNFYWQGLVHLSGHGDTLGPFATAQLSNRDYLCARLAYKLNLRGPAVLVQSACSTSLVAIHMAYRAVLAGECHMALAGGVTLAATQKYGYIYQEGMVNSPDGHCRAFDKEARGTVSGEGAGVVLLKPLKEALSDRDHVHVVVKGSAANNDGVLRVGFSAPSVEGQADVIGDALQMAGVDPDTIGYVETHGTGTVLGDPIEIEGLKTAFRSQRKGFCRIGSVKTNVGHLDTAAGVAGFIKTVLALGNRLIPPSLNFETPNPNIDFSDSPFRVCDAPFPWQPVDGPLRAGVSSFGIGGTNAHVILEEAPAPLEDVGERLSRPWRLLCLSARTETALETLSSRLADHVRRHADIDPGDVCFTLAMGRRRMQRRKMVLFQRLDNAVKDLENGESSQTVVYEGTRLSEDRPVAFMFAGLGAQYSGMARGLFEDEPVFRREMERCAGILNPLLDEDILELLFGTGEAGGDASRIHDIDISQLTVFLVEFAMARLLMSWGIRPQAVTGYSFGEYAAACVAGVFKPEDILPVLVERGRLLKRVPDGGMLSLPFSKSEAMKYLTPGLAVAINNGSSVVAAGPRQEILDLQARLLKEKIFTVLLPATRAMHCPQVEPVCEELAKALRRIAFKAPRIPLAANVTGDWLTAEQAMDPDYWVRHLRQTVQFDAALKCLVDNGATLLVEIGPGRDLCNLAARYLAEGSEGRAIPTMPQPGKQVSDSQFLTRQLGKLWLFGAAVDWRAYYEAERLGRIPLPTYPFEGKAYWIEGNLAGLAANLARKGGDQKQRKDIEDWFYVPSWELSHPGPDAGIGGDLSSCLVFLDGKGLEERLLVGLRRRFDRVFIVTPGEDYRFRNNYFEIRVDIEGDYKRLVGDLAAVFGWPCLVLHCLGVDVVDPVDPVDAMDFVGQLRYGFFSLTFFAGALAGLEPGVRENTGIVVVGRGLFDVLGDEELSPVKTAVLGPCRVVPLEVPGVFCRVVDIVASDDIEFLLEEILRCSGDSLVALRGQKRWVQSYKRVRLGEISGPATYVRRNGVYLITGALGEHGSVGFFLGRWLARQAPCGVAVVGRTPLPPPEEWNSIDDPRVKKLLELESLGARVMYVAADVGDLDRMEEVVRQVEERLGPITGVIHSAAVMGEGTIRFMSESEDEDNIMRQFRPKIAGSLVLARLFKDRELDFCVLMSSLASHLGGIGVNTYTAANNVCDAIAHWVNRDSRSRWISVNWDNWQKSGRPAAEENPLAMPVEDGVEAFHRILSWGGAGQIMTCTVDLDHWLKKRALPQKETAAADAPHTPNRYSELEDWFYRPRWQETPMEPALSSDAIQQPAQWLLFAGDSELSRRAVECLEANGVAPVVVRAGEEFYERSKVEFFINPAKEADYSRLFKRLAENGNPPGIVLHMWSLDLCGPRWLDLDSIDQAMERSLYSVLSIARANGAAGMEDSIRFGVITQSMQPVLGDEGLNPQQAAVLGPLKIIPLEYSTIACKSIDVDGGQQVEPLLLEMAAPLEGFEEVAFRDGLRMKQGYERLSLRSGPRGETRLKMDAVYLVTGGLGGMGLAIARFLVETYRATVILVDREEWAGDDLGDRYILFQADVADLDRMRDVVREAEDSAGPIEGVIHAAGDIDDAGVIQRRSHQDTEFFLRPKIKGTLVLEEVLRHRNLDFTILFSSLGNVLYGGKFGQVAYNAGHEFLDVFAPYKCRTGVHTVTVDWSDWQGIGMAGRAAQRFAPEGDDAPLSIPLSQGLWSFVKALELDVPRVALSVYDLEALARYVNQGSEALQKELDILERGAGAGIVEPRPSLDVEYVEPNTEVQKQLAAMWMEFFAIDRVGIDDDFFELGGDSLKAMTVAGKIQQRLQVNIPLPELFKRSTIRALSQYISGAETETAVPIPLAEKQDYYALSSAQQRLYFMQQMDESSTVYNESTAIVFPRGLEVGKLQSVFQQLIRRHESLRTYFVLRKGEPVQRVLPAGDVEFIVDVEERAGWSDDPRVRDRMLGDFIRPFQLCRAPLLRVAVANGGEAGSLLMVDLHHIVTDGMSMGILRREFLELYNGNQLPPLTLQYKDFAEWQHSEEQRESETWQLRYWKERFQDLPEPLRMPIDFPRTGVPGFEGDIVRFTLNSEISAGLRAMAAAEEATLFILLLTLVYLLLHKISGQEDIVVGTLTAGRPHPDLEPVIGMFVNTLALRQTISPQQEFLELLRLVKADAVESFGHQDCQFDRLVQSLGIRRETGRNPLFDVMFVLKNLEKSGGEAEDAPDPYEFKSQISKFDLIVIGHDSGDAISFTLSYGTHLFRRQTVERFAGYIETIAQRVARQPETGVEDIDLLSTAERQAMRDQLNRPLPQKGDSLVLNRMFEARVEETPEAYAVVMGDDRLTYEQLNVRANRLAHRLLRRGTGPGSIVGLGMRRSVEMAVGILGILKAGAAYLPLEPAWPAKRVRAVLTDADCRLVVVDEQTLDTVQLSALLRRRTLEWQVEKTSTRGQITDLDRLPLTNRSLVDYEAYGPYIGQAMVKHSVTLQATRGCPYKCAYCHRIWPRRHVFRSAENIFDEVQLYYNMGVRRFSFVDDIFNLNRDNSRRFFQLVIDAGMNEDARFFFPNGMRGDILTLEDIDLMVEGGLVNLAIALETASPRLQKEIGKELDLEALRRNIEYFCTRHPHVILELFTIHGFPGETEAEALQTLEFVKSLKWIHFPYVFVLKIYPNTPMYDLAVRQGVSPQAIEESARLAFHELPDTLPFARSFTIKYQADFLNNYFLDRERLRHVLPLQMKTLTEDELAQKYNSYLPTDIRSLADLLEFAGIDPKDLEGEECVAEESIRPLNFNQSLAAHFQPQAEEPDALRVLLLDLSQFFSSASGAMLYDVVEPPLGLMQLLTYARQEHPGKIEGKIAKSRIDFDDYQSLRRLIDDFSPHVIGVRTLTFYKDFFHRSVSLIRQWGFEGVIVAGGPYATSDYNGALENVGIDVVALGEGEATFARLLEAIMANDRQLPAPDGLRAIDGIAFRPKADKNGALGREFLVSGMSPCHSGDTCDQNPDVAVKPDDPAYCIFTSGSTGFPKGTLLEHHNVFNLVQGIKQRIYDRLTGIQRRLKVGLISPLVFDASVKQLFPALLLGHTLVIVPEEARYDGQILMRTYRDEGIDISDGTPAHLSILTETPPDGNTPLPVKFFLIGGEPLPPPLARRFLSMVGGDGAAIVNVYGPTECGDVTSMHLVKENELDLLPRIPIGEVLDHARVLVMGSGGRPLPPGIPGELWISGGGVGRGYLNRPELTGQMFVPYCPGDGEGEARMFYRSGDRVRQLDSGVLEFLGRIDQQVKIRGHRIEPGEIERQLLGFEDITQAAVEPMPQSDGQLVLCAFVTARDHVDAAEVKLRLSRILPDYLVPDFIAVLERLPIGTNGKLDRKRLPALDFTSGADRTPPRDALDRDLTGIWAEVLEVDSGSIGIDANFFELGGHSLRAVKLMALVSRNTGVKLSMTDIFNSPTIRRQADIIRQSAPCGAESPQPMEKQDYYPLSPNQERVWLALQLNPTSAAYHISGAIEVGAGDRVETEALRRSLLCIMARHESFRTGFREHGGGPVQFVRENLPLPLRVKDLTALSEAEEQTRLKALRNQLEFAPFDLTTPPLWRVTLIRGSSKDLLLVCVHHIIADGWSMGILRDEFLNLYRGFSRGDIPLLERLPLQYRDVACWQRRLIEDSAANRRAREFWNHRLSKPLPPVRLPLKSQSNEATSAGGYAFVVEDSVALKLERLGSDSNTSLFLVVFAALNLALSRVSEQKEFIVGLLGAGRDHEVTQKIVGFFVNTLIYHNRVEDALPFRRFLEDVNRDVLDMVEHQWYPLEKAMDVLDIPFPDIRVLFNMFNERHGDNVEHAGFFPVSEGEVKFPLIFYADHVDRRLAVRCHFRRHLFGRDTIEFLMNQFNRILSAVVEDPQKTVKEILFPKRKKRLSLSKGGSR
jgi:amino acid adenylation domain-containing protein